MKISKLWVPLAAFAVWATCGAGQHAWATPVSLNFTVLDNVTGVGNGQTGNDATFIYRADLAATGLDEITSIRIVDTSSGVGGSSGAFTGVDIDGVIISNVLTSDAIQVNSLPKANQVILSPSTTQFIAGTQTAPVAPNLFGTTGGNIDFAFARLDAMDADGILPGSGYFSMGAGGELSINFDTPIDPNVHRYLYIGEVGGNGETFAAEAVPEPHSLLLALMAGLLCMASRIPSLRR